MSERTIKRLVPGAKVQDIGHTNERTKHQVIATCDWKNWHRINVKDHASLELWLSAYVGEPGLPDLDMAKRQMAQAVVGGQENSGKRFQELTGLGDEAFGVYEADQTEITTEITMRVANVYVFVTYSVDRSDAEPVEAQATVRAARSVARDIVETLNSCTTCGH